ncbi:tigger transposable element-derived protein 1-like [Palaemon carinicauda]|uniref:tigger transposable element-derived protein 1-like n=1 Tax=Palaemon carinicauda TaxID=392227 RepID=UPI0035B5C392
MVLVTPLKMAPKDPLTPTSSSEPKKKRKIMMVNKKVKLLDMLKAGSSYASVARIYRVNESTVRYIEKDEMKIHKTASITFSKDTRRVVTPCNKTIVQMENALSMWISDCREKKQGLVREIQEEGWSSQRSFVWGGCLGRPRGSSSLRRGRVHELIKEDGYLLEQVFNMDETGLFWKRMPSRTFLYKDEVKKPGFKAHKDRVTLLVRECRRFHAQAWLNLQVIEYSGFEKQKQSLAAHLLDEL